MENLTVLESDVLDLLPIGSGQKILIKDISRLYGINERKIYQVISSLIKKGVPVVAARNGVDRGCFIATNTQELAEGTHAYKEQAKHMTDRITSLYSIDLKNWPTQVKSQKNVKKC